MKSMHLLVVSLLLLVVLILGCSTKEEPLSDCDKYSGTLGEEVYMASPDAETCLDNGCEVKVVKCYPAPEGTLDLGWCKFKCIEKI